MAIKIQSVDEVVEMTGIKAVVHGESGSGKTMLAATAGCKTIIISAESGLLTLGESKASAIEKGCRDYAPENCKVIQVDNLGDVEEVHAMLSAKKMCDWIVMDSVTEVGEKILAYEKQRSTSNYDIYPNYQDNTLKALKQFRDLTKMGYNVLFTAKQQKYTDSASNITNYYPMMPGGKMSDQVPYIFDFVFAMRQKTNEDGSVTYFMQCEKDPQFMAKNRGGFLGKHEPASLKHIENKIRRGLEKAKAERKKKKDESAKAKQKEAEKPEAEKLTLDK